MTRRSNAVRALVTAACALALAACSGDGGSGDGSRDPGSAAPLEVELGEAFTWNDFTVEDGWKMKGITRSVDVKESVVTPEVSGTIVNDSAEERAAIFRMVFTVDGDPVATVNCSARTMVQDQTMPFLCPGINTTMPDEYDAITVVPYERDTGESDSDESGT